MVVSASDGGLLEICAMRCGGVLAARDCSFGPGWDSLLVFVEEQESSIDLTAWRRLARRVLRRRVGGDESFGEMGLVRTRQKKFTAISKSRWADFGRAGAVWWDVARAPSSQTALPLAATPATPASQVRHLAPPAGQLPDRHLSFLEP